MGGLVKSPHPDPLPLGEGIKIGLATVFVGAKEFIPPLDGELRFNKKTTLRSSMVVGAKGFDVPLAPLDGELRLNKKTTLRSSFVVGAKGFEPSTSCTPCKHASRTAPRPDCSKIIPQSWILTIPWLNLRIGRLAETGGLWYTFLAHLSFYGFIRKVEHDRLLQTHCRRPGS